MNKALLPLFLLLSSGSYAQAEVWTVSNTWNSSWESEYSRWVRSEWSVNIFLQDELAGKPNPFKGLRSDCADTVYSMRMVFAYLHKLPFAIKDASRGQGLISNKMSRWDGQSEPAKARAFLNLLFDVVSTKSLPSDSYPVELSSSTVKPGSMILTTTKNHHSWTIQDILAVGEPHLVFNSTIGRTTGSRLQQRTSWPNPSWVFEGDSSPSGNAGIRAFRPINYIGAAVWEVPGYSEEQYRTKLSDYNKTLKARLGSRRETSEEKMRRLMANVCEDFKGRVSAVKDGTDYRSHIHGRCMGRDEYDTYSTPSRDKRSIDAIVALREAYQNVDRADLEGKTASQLRRIFKGEGESYCELKYSSGASMDVAEFARRFLAGAMSSDPNEPASVRWGEKRGGTSCPRY